MKFSEMVSYAKELRAKDADLLVIIPSRMAYDVLVSHLEYLSRQTYQKFNAILVVGTEFDDARLVKFLEKKKYGFGIIVAKENERRGCSGGFYAGQRYALEKGYGYAIMADDDCMPVDPKLVESLYARKDDAPFVSPTMHLVVTKDFRLKNDYRIVSNYGFFSTDIFRKYGLYYLPLFHGADDGEYKERTADVKCVSISNYVEHPYTLGGNFVFKNIDRSWLFLLAGMVILREGPLKRAVFFACTMLIGLFFMPKYGTRLFFTMNRLLFTFTYGKKAAQQIKSGFEEFIMAPENPAAFENGFEVFDDCKPQYLELGAAGKLLDVLKTALRCFRKKVVVTNTFSYFKVLVMGMFARELYYRLEQGKYLLIARRGGVVAHAARIALFAIALPVYIAVVAPAYLALKFFRQPRTMGFGAEG